jgi:hypothetical protein
MGWSSALPISPGRVSTTRTGPDLLKSETDASQPFTSTTRSMSLAKKHADPLEESSETSLATVAPAS